MVLCSFRYSFDVDINEALMLPSREKKGVLISKIDPETLQMITIETVVAVIKERERERESNADTQSKRV